MAIDRETAVVHTREACYLLLLLLLGLSDWAESGSCCERGDYLIAGDQRNGERMKGMLWALAGVCMLGLLAVVRLELNHQATRADLELKLDHERQLREEQVQAMRTELGHERQLRAERELAMTRELTLLNDRISDRAASQPAADDSHEQTSSSPLHSPRQLQDGDPVGGGGEGVPCLNSDEVAYAAMLSTHTVSQRVREFSEQVLPGLLAAGPGLERGTCLCSTCRNMTMPGAVRNPS